MRGMSTTSKARQLRKKSTDAEVALWRHLRNRQLAGCKFRRQVPIDPYVVDFVCFEQRLVIELDGGHHQSQAEDDKARTVWLENQGFRVLRYWNNEVLVNVDGVALSILEAIEHPHLSPLPSRERKSSPSPLLGEGRDEGENPSPHQTRMMSSDLEKDTN